MADIESSNSELYLDLFSENIIERNEAALLGVQNVCSKCGSGKIAVSSSKGLVSLLKQSFTQKTPYQCLRCYNRFWLSEKEGRSRGRLVLWLLLIVALLLCLWFFVLNGQSPLRSSGNSTELDSVDSSQSSDDAQPDIVSIAEDSVSEAARKAAIEDQLALAQFAEQDSARLNSTDSAKLEDIIAARDGELEAQAKIEVIAAIDRWRSAWQQGNAQAYLLHYADSFKPGKGQSLDAWKAQRKERVTPDKKIEVLLSDFNISFDPDINLGTVIFTQEYRSGSYADRSRKRLRLSRQQQTWKIVSEVQLP